ncbi:amino acid ABC transporter permease [Synechococcus sp. RSCCF101]|uniref:amino acid ABC transporter permease n=1 Tax=Synechococcus sp. RSCCF101 TaxID=2511069 RepID=UPI001244F772|nr:amino acid ABC transporter permease [Synechococcus sp. RSCCF101]QEY31904.1 amino acid ABC transporter permease [Synechococcus sp. RSCCF101]
MTPSTPSATASRPGRRAGSLLTRLRRELFRTPLDALITLVLLSGIGWVLGATLQWAFTAADWQVVSGNLPLYLAGSYPPDQLWRPLSWMAALLLLSGLTLRPGSAAVARWLPAAWIALLPVGLVMLAGGLGLEGVSTRQWGGLALTLMLTAASGVIALPLGTVLALARRSSLPLVHGTASAYIELMRAVPLISVLFFGQLLIPLFLPGDWEVNRVLRAVLTLAAFAAAYVAEDVRSGLQALPRTQSEAAHALGLSDWQATRFVLLPQALRIALPALANQAVGLLQNTSLLAILGLVELLGISRSLLANPAFLSRHLEVYCWLALLYWAVCTVMALMARRLENRLNRGQ